MKPSGRATASACGASGASTQHSAGDDAARVSGLTRLPVVAICSPSLAAISGVSTHANLLLESVLASRFRLVHFQLGSEGRTESPPLRTARTLLTPFTLAAFLRRQRPAILHLNSSMAFKPIIRDVVLTAIARCFRVRVILQIHGGRLPQQMGARHATLQKQEAHGREVRRSLHEKVVQRLLQQALSLCHAIVVLSFQEHASYRQFCPRTPVSRIPNAIDLQAAADQADGSQDADVSMHDTAPRRPRLTPPGALRLVYVGRLIPEKGLFEALDAIALLVDSGRFLDFTIVGNGPAANALAARTKALNLNAVVHFVGHVAGVLKTRLWQDAEVLLLPSYSEGLPYALLEAMASGIPAITCPVGAIPDVVQDGVHGLLIQPRDCLALAEAIARLDDDRPLLATIAIAARRRVHEAFSIDHLAENFATLYSGMLDVTS